MSSSLRTKPSFILVSVVLTWGILGLFEAVGAFSLSIIHTNDVHSHISSFTDFGVSCLQNAESSNGSPCYGGVARRHSAIRQLLEERGGKDSVLVVDAGDEFQGTVFFTFYKGNASAFFMNSMGYDAAALGNHEFDDGPGLTASFMRKLDFPVVVSNLDWSSEPSFDGVPNLSKFIVVQKGGEQIGIVGYITEDLPVLSSMGPNLRVLPIAESIQPIIDTLLGRGVSKIVAISHAGYLVDKEVAQRVSGIDVIVGGHSHTYLGGVNARSAGPYPTVETSPQGQKVCIVQDGEWGKYLGVLNVTFDAQGDVLSCVGEPILLDSSVAADPVIAEQVRQYSAPLEALMDKIIGESSADLDGSCGTNECTFGNAVADALMWYARDHSPQIALTNGGSIRCSLPKGNVSQGQIIECLPFEESLEVFDVSGAALLEALENSVSRMSLDLEHSYSGRFLQISGLRYSFNPSHEAGRRVIGAWLVESDHNEKIQPAATYRVVSQAFILGGGDGYSGLAQKATNRVLIQATMGDAFSSYVRAFSPIQPAVSSRIVMTKSDASSDSASKATTSLSWANILFIVIGSILAVAVLVCVGLFVRHRIREQRSRSYREIQEEMMHDIVSTDFWGDDDTLTTDAE